MHQAPTGESRQGQPPRTKRPVYRWIRLVAAATLAGLCIGLALQRIGPFPQRPPRRRIWCAANLNGIGKGIAMYRAEHEDAFPANLEVLIPEGAVPWKMLRCPSVDKKMPQEPSAEPNRRCDYFYHPPKGVLDVRDDGAETRPAARPDALVLCDYEGNHEGGRNVAFAAGHVKWLTEEEFQAELARPVNAAFAAALRKAEAGAVDSRPPSATSASSTRPSSPQAASSEVNQER